MVFWLAVLAGGLGAWCTVQIGFYGSWILFFNLLLSVYMAIFVAPAFISNVPDLTGVGPYGGALTVICIAIATLCISYGISYGVLSGQLRAPFPNVFENVGAGILGFLSGYLVCSFLAFVFSLTPMSESDASKSFGFDHTGQGPNRSYVCGWCNAMNFFLGARDLRPADAGAAVQSLLAKTTAPTLAPSATAPPLDPGRAAEPNPQTRPNRLSGEPRPARMPRGKLADDATTTDAEKPAKEEDATEDAKEEQDGGEPKSPPKPSRPQTFLEEAGVNDGESKVMPPRERRRTSKTSKTLDVDPADLPALTPQTSPFVPDATMIPSPRKTVVPRENPFKIATPKTVTQEPERVEGSQGPLSGLWRDPNGVTLRFDDDGKTVTLKLDGWATKMPALSGKLTREDKADAKVLTGSVTAVFFADPGKPYNMRVTATLVESNMFSVKYFDYPTRWARGKAVKGTSSQVFTRVQGP